MIDKPYIIYGSTRGQILRVFNFAWLHKNYLVIKNLRVIVT